MWRKGARPGQLVGVDDLLSRPGNEHAPAFAHGVVDPIYLEANPMSVGLRCRGGRSSAEHDVTIEDGKVDGHGHRSPLVNRDDPPDATRCEQPITLVAGDDLEDRVGSRPGPARGKAGPLTEQIGHGRAQRRGQADKGAGGCLRRVFLDVLEVVRRYPSPARNFVAGHAQLTAAKRDTLPEVARITRCVRGPGRQIVRCHTIIMPQRWPTWSREPRQQPDRHRDNCRSNISASPCPLNIFRGYAAGGSP